MIMHNLFPTPVGFYNLDRELTEKELKFVNDQVTRPNQGNVTSVDNKLFEASPMKDLADFVKASMNEYFQAVYAPKHEVELYFTQSWANYTKPGEYHHKHEHPNSFISGVFYVNADKAKDKIYFYKNGYQQLTLPTENYNLYNSSSWWFEVGTCDLVLFPSSLTHMVQTTDSEDTRISIAFNTFLKGYVGEDIDLTGLHL